MCLKRAIRYPSAWVLIAQLLLCVATHRHDDYENDGDDGESVDTTNTDEWSGGDGGSAWWDVNVTNSTELCSGVMHINSNETISSGDRIYSTTTIDGGSSPCSSFYLYQRCNLHNYTTLMTDSVSYINAQSRIVAKVNPNATEGYTNLYYKLCYTSLSNLGESEVIQCVSNGTTMISNYEWKESGVVILTVHVYVNDSFNDSDFLDCSRARVIIASDYGIDLNVELVSEPQLPNVVPLAYQEAWEEEGAFIIGNMTFIAETNMSYRYSHVAYHYKYIVDDPSTEETVYSSHPNLTRELLETGDYYYTVHAIAVLDRILAYHANYSGSFSLLEAVSDVVMQVGGNNSIRVGSREVVKIAAEGSPPITVCWSETKVQTKESTNTSPESPLYPDPASPPPAEDHQDMKDDFLSPVQGDCIVLNDSNSTIFTEYRTFNVVGTFNYLAHFYNRASSVRENFTFHVTPAPSPTVVASSATAAVVLAVLAALAVLIAALIIGGYIPYRRYKNRMTETADFRFVDLSETGTYWDGLKLKTNQFMDYFRRSHHNEKIGLVNLGSIPTAEEERRRLFYGSNTLSQFAPYETL